MVSHPEQTTDPFGFMEDALRKSIEHGLVTRGIYKRVAERLITHAAANGLTIHAIVEGLVHPEIKSFWRYKALELLREEIKLWEDAANYTGQ